MVKHLRYITFFQISMLVFGACESTGPGSEGDDEEIPPKSDETVSISTDKAAYKPGQAVTFSVSGSLPREVMVRYTHLDSVIRQSSLNSTTWQWTPPNEDFKGYMAELYAEEDDTEKNLATIGIDVSSDWTVFPRYGFLSDYGNMKDSEIASVIENLNRHHITGIQFYDWHYKHHRMLAGTAENPQPVWENIANEDVYFSTVDRYISTAHKHNMSTMFYNLVYGVLSDAAEDGISEQWYIYTDQNNNNRDRLSLPTPPFKSDIYLVNPSNEEWQKYMTAEINKVYSAFDFDGFHMDQLGNRGDSYTFDGTSVNLSQTFPSFINSIKQADPKKYLVMNAVNQYGQSGIAASPTDFLYTEVWPPNESYGDLAQIIRDNNSFGNGEQKSVLAAYVNYDLANREGYFNTPSVLFTNAVIFAFGGSHLELGEHMLGQEYFPNDNLSMREDLSEVLTSYYDFLVGYENLLRGKGSFNSPEISTTSNDIFLNQWPAQQGKVSVVGRTVGNRQVIHLLNFTDAETMNWRDNNGIQPYPNEKKNIPLSLTADQHIEKIWYATPDDRMGMSTELQFSQVGTEVTFTLPYLKYWSMIVVEYK